MAFANIGGRGCLFLAESDAIDRYAWRAGTLGRRHVVVHNLPDGGAHPLKNVVVANDNTVFFDIGSASNASPPGGTRPPQATVMAVDPGGGRLRVLATGVRNGDGLSFARDGTLDGGQRARRRRLPAPPPLRRRCRRLSAGHASLR
jgi:glucose/arabinose dehydrogenase